MPDGRDDIDDDGPVFRFEPSGPTRPGGSDDSLFGDVPDLAPGEGTALFGQTRDDEPPAPDPSTTGGSVSAAAVAQGAAGDDDALAASAADEAVSSDVIEAGVDDATAVVASSHRPSTTAPGDIAEPAGAASQRDGGPAFRFDDPGGEPSAPLPHWTEPPTGVLRIGDGAPELDDGPRTEPDTAPTGSQGVVDDDRLEAWAALGTSQPAWDEGRRGDVPDDVVRVGGQPPAATGTWTAPDDGVTEDLNLQPRTAGRDLPIAIASGLAIAATALAVLVLGPPWLMVLIVAALAALASGELFTGLRRAGHRPAHLLGVTASCGIVLAAYWKGPTALVVVLALVMLFSFAHFLSEPSDAPLTDWATTVAGVLWIGLLASFGALLLAGTHGVGAFLVAAVGTVANDVGAYAVGRIAGRSPLSPEISPNKTWEGLVGGMAAALVAVVAFSILGGGMNPVDGFLDAIVVGVAIAVAAPVGDLAQSLVKRSLGVKDMGSVLPGHGGLMDRFDGLLFALPAVWLAMLLLDLAPVGVQL